MFVDPASRPFAGRLVLMRLDLHGNIIATKEGAEFRIERVNLDPGSWRAKDRRSISRSIDGAGVDHLALWAIQRKVRRADLMTIDPKAEAGRAHGRCPQKRSIWCASCRRQSSLPSVAL